MILRVPSVATGINSNSMDNGNFWISTNGNGQFVVNANISGETTVSVYNSVGQKLSSKKLKSKSEVLNKVLAPGVYLMTVTNAGKTITKKVIID